MYHHTVSKWEESDTVVAEEVYGVKFELANEGKPDKRTAEEGQKARCCLVQLDRWLSCP
jgi:hypothetical protein